MSRLSTPRPGAFRQQGYVHLPGVLGFAELSRLEQEYALLLHRGTGILAAANAGALDLAGHYRNHPGDPIVVPEAGQPEQVCRLEYLAGCSEYIRTELVPRLAALVAEAIGEPAVLFKDKCNLKQPGGGAFPPHQDITAYQHFAAQYHVTAALMLDPATLENGCLQMAADYLQAAEGCRRVNTPLGPLPILPSCQGGRQHGDVHAEIADRLRWTPVEAAPGDVILFDSFVPHRSEPNRSAHSRRVMFFTFNLAADGDHYATYYRAKREDPNNPMFHVSTPTVHTSLAEASPA